VSVPRAAPHAGAGQRFVAFLLGVMDRRSCAPRMSTHWIIRRWLAIPRRRRYARRPFNERPLDTSRCDNQRRCGAVVLLALLAIPVGALVIRGGAEGLRQLVEDSELKGALALTAMTATAATLVTVLLGTPLAYLLARERMPAGSLVSAIVELPLLIPHPVAGIALLLAFGRASPAGAAMARVGLGIVGSPLGISLAMLFVAAPLYVSAARESIARVDRHLRGRRAYAWRFAVACGATRHPAVGGTRAVRRGHRDVGARRQRVRCDRDSHLQSESRERVELRSVHCLWARRRATGGCCARAAGHGPLLVLRSLRVNIGSIERVT
jgi:hypothetical protein